MFIIVLSQVFQLYKGDVGRYKGFAYSENDLSLYKAKLREFIGIRVIVVLHLLQQVCNSRKAMLNALRVIICFH
jgi:hypothetical protein